MTVDSRDAISISLDEAFDYGVALHFIAASMRRRASKLSGVEAERTATEGSAWLEKARRLERTRYERAIAAIERGDIADAKRLTKYRQIVEGAKSTRIAR
ncbi:MAG: hypothetical protein KIT25_20415 [Enhydrobacter sp.]|nr:MAG: hypothetical protein KIT25_20415 [Enhydrobacter sp.]